MSCYEGQNGRGLMKKTDLKAFKEKLIEAHNAQLSRFGADVLKRSQLKPATSRTTSFPLLEKFSGDDGVELYAAGTLSLEPKDGTFRFSIEENNHSVDNVAEFSAVYGTLMGTLNGMDAKGAKYGAETYYWSEYDEDEHGHKTPGSTAKYGAWMDKWQKEVLKNPPRRAAGSRYGW